MRVERGDGTSEHARGGEHSVGFRPRNFSGQEKIRTAEFAFRRAPGELYRASLRGKGL